MLNPTNAVPDIPGTGTALLSQHQIDRPPMVLFTLGVRCLCGERLTGCIYTFAPSTLHIRGVCLSCGTQDAIFAPPLTGSRQAYETQAEGFTEAVAGHIEAWLHELASEGGMA